MLTEAYALRLTHTITLYLSKAAGTEGGPRARLLAQYAHTAGSSSFLSPWASTGLGTGSGCSPSLPEQT